MMMMMVMMMMTMMETWGETFWFLSTDQNTPGKFPYPYYPYDMSYMVDVTQFHFQWLMQSWAERHCLSIRGAHVPMYIDHSRRYVFLLYHIHFWCIICIIYGSSATVYQPLKKVCTSAISHIFVIYFYVQNMYIWIYISTPYNIWLICHFLLTTRKGIFLNIIICMSWIYIYFIS